MKRLFGTIGAALLFGVGSALAQETPFTWTVLTDTIPQGQLAFEQDFRGRFDNGFSGYDAADLATSLGYGITKDFQLNVTLSGGYLHGAADADDIPLGAARFPRNDWKLHDLTAEFAYQVLDVHKDGMGLTFSLAPEWKTHDLYNNRYYDGGGYGLQYKALVQKNLASNRLILSYNLVLGTQSVRYLPDVSHGPGPPPPPGAHDYQNEFDLDNDAGVAWRFSREFSGGLELRNENASLGHHGESFIWVGPTLHFGNDQMWATVGWLEKVYRSSASSERTNTPLGDDLYLRSQQRHEITLKIGVPL